ncbi:replication initiation protein [Acinetobacter baumannii]|uniref:replication initiation protein n=1 Tax=Acinetobacter baumannii TaxID=470 RepID=UPI003892BFB0
MPALKKKIISFSDDDKNYFPLSAPDKRYPAELAVFQNIFWQLKHEKSPKDDVLKILFLFSPKVRLAEDPHEGMEFCITAKEYAELTGLKVDSAYTILNRVVDALYEHSVIFYHSDKDRDIRTRLINSCSYKDGCFYISFTHFALYIMYVFNQQNSFTKFKVKSAISLSGHGLKLYPFLIQNEFRYNFDVQLSDLKTALGLNADSYPEYRDFKTTILKPHIDAINQKTELTVEFKAIKKSGRKASHVNFTVTKKRTVKAQEPKKKVPDEPQEEQPKITATMVYKEIIKNSDLLVRFRESGEAINEMIDRIKEDFKNGNQERWLNKLQEFGITFEETAPF